MHSGYIKLWRKLELSPIFTNSEAVHLFIYLLIKASRTARKTTHKTTVINLLPGQLVTGRKKLSEATGINESKVYRLLELLKSEQQIEQQTNKHYSIITITNWLSYQESEQQIEQQMNNKRTTDEQQMNTIQEVKELKNEKKESKSRFHLPDWLDKDKWQDFVDMRIKIKKPMTDKAKEMAVTKLGKIRDDGHNPNDSLDESTFHSWQDVFPPKKVVTFPAKTEEKVHYL